ncbi:alpha/beta hydrolase, partial [Pseudomonas protegens]|nr:alpha/beta hydrolase [Pseudomonas protegens]
SETLLPAMVTGLDVDMAGAGHINVKSGHHRWEQGFAYLYRLQNRMEQHALRRA